MTPASIPLFQLDRRAIFGPYVDLALTSGLSIAVMLALILFYIFMGSGEAADPAGMLPKLLLLQVLLNWPHFLVSYRLLYQRRENLSAFPMASIGVPVLLIAICVGATLPVLGGNGLLEANLQIAYAMWIFASLYLAWHYTGQAWGVMMVYTHLTKRHFTQIERTIIRSGLRVLIVWHVIWGIQTLPPIPFATWLQSDEMSVLSNVAAVVSFILGGGVLLRNAWTTPGMDLRIFGPWLAVYLWYFVLWLMPDAFVFIQLSHALQYLVFTARVELNRDMGDTHRQPARPAFLRTGLIYGLSILGGLVIFYLPEVYVISPTGAPTLPALIAIAINIHHYYTDSAIWKMRNDGVRRRLFSHLGPNET